MITEPITNYLLHPADRVKKTAACERNIFNSDKPDAKLSCPEGRAIQVESAMYGRQSLGACPSKFPHNNRYGHHHHYYKSVIGLSKILFKIWGGLLHEHRKTMWESGKGGKWHSK